MKRILYTTALILMTLFVVSCVSEEKDLFDDSVANRLDQKKKEYEELLTSAENGWLLEYYVGKDVKKTGGFNMLMEFNKNGTVVVSSELEDDSTAKASSLFAFIADQSIVLSLDTYNEIFHWVSEPSSGDPTGRNGDYEFVVVDATNDVVKLKGKKYSLYFTLTRIQPSDDWVDVLDKIEAQRVKVETFGNFNVIVDGTQIGTTSIRDYVSAYEFVLQDDKSISENAIRTTDGLKFYKPITIGNKTVQSFRWDDVAKKYQSVEENAKVELVPYHTANSVAYADYIGTYTLSYFNVNDELKTKTIVIEELVENEKLVMKGFSVTGYPVPLSYDKLKGQVSLTVSKLGTVSGNVDIVLCAFEGKSTSYSTAAGFGLISKLESRDKLKFSFVDNGVWGNTVSNGVLIGAFVNGVFNGYYDWMYNMTLTKQ